MIDPTGQALAVLTAIPWWTYPAAAALAVAVGVTAKKGTRWLEVGGTLAAAGIATAVAVTGMWRVFGDALHMDGPGRAALSGFLEIALLTSAVQARRSLLTRHTRGVDGVLVWVLATVSAVLASWDTPTGIGKALRFAAPYVAAAMWERSLAAEAREAAPDDNSPPGIAWRITPRRVAVWLRLADPTTRHEHDIDRTGLVGLVSWRGYRFHTTPTGRLWALPRRVAYGRFRRAFLSAVRHDPDPDSLPTRVATGMAGLFQLSDATAPDAVKHLSPWDRVTPQSQEGEPPAADREPSDRSRPSPAGQQRKVAGRKVSTGRQIARARAKTPTATQQEIADQLKISPRTVQRYWPETAPSSQVVTPIDRAGGVST